MRRTRGVPRPSESERKTDSEGKSTYGSCSGVAAHIGAAFLTGFFSEACLAAGELGDVGSFAKRAKVEIEMTGPDSRGKGTPNPFAVFVDVTFRSPGGEAYKVPGFYDGDGAGGLDGNIWKVRLHPGWQSQRPLHRLRRQGRLRL